MVHDTSGGGEDNVTELTGRKKSDDPLLHVTELDVVARADDTSLVEAEESLADAMEDSVTLEDLPAVKLDDDLAVAVVIDLLELSDVAYDRKMSVCCE